jgi:hypothetical protein
VTAVVRPASKYSFSAWAWWGSAVDGGDGSPGSGDDASSDADANSTSDGGAGAAATPYEDVKVLMVALCPDGSAHFGACVSGILAPERTWTELAGTCDGSILDLCGEAGPPQVELYFDTGDPGIGLCVDDVSLTAK